MTTDDVKNVDAMDDVTTAESKKTDEHMIPKSRLDAVIQERDNAQKRADAMEKAAKDAETKRLKEQEDYKALYQKAEQELAELKPKADKLASAESVLKETLAAYVEQIPEDKRALIPDELSTEQQLRWIAKNRSLLSKPQAPFTGAGKQGGGDGSTVTLTAEEAAIAAAFNVKPEDYAKYKQ